MSDALNTTRSLLRPLQRKDIAALAELTRSNREFLAATSPLRQEEYFTDEGQERAALVSLQAAESGIALPMVIVDAAGDLVGTLNFNSIIRGAFQSASLGSGFPRTEMVRASLPQRSPLQRRSQLTSLASTDSRQKR